MAKTEKWYTKRYLEEIIFFFALFILIMLPELIKPINGPELLKTFLFFSIVYGLALLHRYFIFSFFMEKRFWLYGISASVFTLLGTTVLLASDYYWIDPTYYQTAEETMFEHYISYFVLCAISTAVILSIFLVRNYSNEVQKRNEAQLRLSEVNIKYLHAQLNPHFFFNMFNNLYGVSLTDPERTPELILKLSNLMRYQLENANKDTVTLQEELAFISSYISAEKERVGQRCTIAYTIDDPHQRAAHYTLAPFLLITLVENAFKHSLTVKNPWFVSIEVQIKPGTLSLEIRNSLADEGLQNNSTGIGLTNIRQRLELLYTKRYTLEAKQQEDYFRTHLVIQLN